MQHVYFLCTKYNTGVKYVYIFSTTNLLPRNEILKLRLELLGKSVFDFIKSSVTHKYKPL